VFEVASVKRNISDEVKTTYHVPPSGTVRITNATVRTLVSQAYQLNLLQDRFALVVPPNHPLLRGSSVGDLSVPRFDIDAKIPDGTAPGQQFVMLRALLADRFKLRVHKETRPTPIYALTVAREGRLGPSLRPSPVDCESFRSRRAMDPGLQLPLGSDGRPLCTADYDFTPDSRGFRTAGQISRLVTMLQGSLDRPLLDATGLTGSFEWTLLFDFTGTTADAQSTTAFTAVQEQLGLRLEARTAPYEVLVIDSVEMPTEN
jgi:uncharacterized protein (TIGR03435 family)